MENAFIDFLTIKHLEHQGLEIMPDAITGSIEILDKQLLELEPKSNTTKNANKSKKSQPAIKLDSNSANTEEIAQLIKERSVFQKRLENTKQDIDFMKSFVYGKTVTEGARKEALKNYQTYNQSYDEKRSIGWLATDFLSFWKQHGGDYIRKKKQEDARNEKGGKTKLKQRWDSMIDSFVEYRKQEDQKIDRWRIVLRTSLHHFAQ
ncbi:MAG: hypothetical protein HC767_06820 [Akkermansiaceae bacterium]|nr:hypothetical protein [Akkermansiaceae bacterium]